MTALEFNTQLDKFEEEASTIQAEEVTLKQKQILHLEKFNGFLKENGMTDNFTLPGFAKFIKRKVTTDS